MSNRIRDRRENRIREWREKREKSIEDVAYAIGISPSYLSRLETGGRNVSLKHFPALARVLGVKQSELVQDRDVTDDGNDDDGAGMLPVQGFASAGSDEVHFEDGQGPFDEIDAPIWASDKTVAVVIRGTSLGILLQGWYALYDDRRDPPDESMFGHVCICGLEGGRVVIKKLRRGSAPGLFHLESATEGTLFDVPVRWAAKVRGMEPPSTSTRGKPRRSQVKMSAPKQR